MSKAEAGVLSASYAAGTLLASLPAGLLAARFGPRRTVIGGLLLLGVSSVVFGFADEFVLLDAARFTQGVAGALIWSGALTWLITASPPSGAAAVIGTALGTAVAGALLGPALGRAGGRRSAPSSVFGSVLVVAAALRLRSPRACPRRSRPKRQGLREVVETIVSRPVLTAPSSSPCPR